MDKEVLEKIEHNTCKLLEEFAAKGFHSPADIQTAKNLLSSMVKIKTIRAMDNYSDEGGWRGRYNYNSGADKDHYYDEERISMKNQLEKIMQEAQEALSKM